MACCGRRQSIPSQLQPPAVSGPPGANMPAARGSTTELRYLDRGAIRIVGPITRTQYEFSVSAPVQSVDTRDAAVLLRTRYFKPALKI
jgi:hypothetical protein